MKTRAGWRRFLPKTNVTHKQTGADNLEHILYTVLHDAPDSRWKAADVEWLNGAIEMLRYRVQSAAPSEKAVLLRALLIVQAPRAARAQAQMDAHKHGYHNREKRLFELIDFNDTFVDAVLALAPHERPGFAQRLYADIRKFSKQAGASVLSDEQYDAIVRGLSREIAVYLAARQLNYEARMTSRTDDALGIDMIITNAKTRNQLNIDCKTPSAFRYRLEDLVKEGRITDDELLKADEEDYITVVNRHNNERIPVTIVCIRPERLGEIKDFEFSDYRPIHQLIEELFAGQHQHKL